jgi:hypothetical protein
MASEDEELRAELEAACEAIRRRLDDHLRSQRTVWGNRGDALAKKALRDRLAELEDALCNLGRRGA